MTSNMKHEIGTHSDNLWPNQYRFKNRLSNQIHHVFKKRMKNFKPDLNSNNNFPDTIDVMVVAHCQSGKGKGKAIAQEIIETEIRNNKPWFAEQGLPLKGNVSAKSWLWVGVSDTTLINQHIDKKSSLRNYTYDKNQYEEIKMEEVMYFDLTASYAKSSEYIDEKFKKAITECISEGRYSPVLIVDEAHYGMGEDGRFSALKEWFKKHESNVQKFIVCATATASMLNGVKLKDIKKEVDLDILEVIEAPAIYWGTNEGGIIGSGREKDIDSLHCNMKYQDQAIHFVEEYLYPRWQHLLKIGKPGNFILRFTDLRSKKSEKNFRYAVNKVWNDNYDGPNTPYINICNSKTSADFNYEQFMEYCGKDGKHKALTENKIILIHHGIQAGVEIDKSTLGLWYDAVEVVKNEKKKNNGIHGNSDVHVQRVGRNFGPNAGDYDYPIFCDVRLIKDYMNNMKRLEEFCLKTNPLAGEYIYEQSGTHAGNKKERKKFQVIDVIPDPSAQTALQKANQKTGMNLNISVRSGTQEKDLGDLLIRDSLSGHSRNFAGTRTNWTRVKGYDDRYVMIIHMDQKPQHVKCKQNTNIVWNALADTEWGNLQNQYCLVILQDCDDKTVHNNNTCYAIKKDESEMTSIELVKNGKATA